MSPEQLFLIVNAIAGTSWLLLAVLPRHRWVTEVVTGRLVPAVFAAVYIVLIVSTLGSLEGGFSTLGGVAALFANRWMLLAGWVHYLAFDLLIGTWEVRDAQRRNIPRIVVLPSLFLTFMFGPAGWLFYLALRSPFTKAAAPRLP